jgi:hypothetical protein
MLITPIYLFIYFLKGKILHDGFVPSYENEIAVYRKFGAHCGGSIVIFCLFPVAFIENYLFT